MNQIEGISFIEAQNHAELSQFAADILTQQISEKRDSLLTLASGGTPTDMYKKWISAIKDNHIDISELRLHKLDEWCGLKENDPATCEYYIRNHVLEPLDFPLKRYFGANSEAKDPIAECVRVASRLSKEGPADICILGLGKNGHLGFNEPGQAFHLRTHTVQLSEESMSHNMVSKTNRDVTRGMTSGIADILQADNILFLVSGKHKAQNFKRFFTERTVTPEFPASVLWLHKSVYCIYDKDAASLVDSIS